ncbi:MAG: hypothetical protein EZS28_037821 [Streblomastix strix]|uniref:Uncharacterized protein n=1 Tax=Streblomastix strix TaxID=222440 RepID=A0A5J4U9S0_9EUKA|nr:MAG: hypothetical protein EZS28_037821 [Streblomastix strix]
MTSVCELFEVKEDYTCEDGTLLSKGEIVLVIKKGFECFTFEKNGKIGKIPKGKLKKQQLEQNQRKAPENIITGYHQTSAEAARSIIASGFRVGAGDIVGGGIYFALTKEDTERKAHQKGVILQCDVDVGSCKIMQQLEPQLTGDELKKQGFDSVFFPSNYMNVGLNYPEYAIYDPTRVKHIQYDQQQIQVKSEVEQRIKALEEDQRRKALEEEQRRKTLEEEQKRKTLDEEQKRKALEEEEQRKALEEEQRRKTLDEEQRRKLLQEEQRRKALKEEEQRKALEEEQKRKQLEEEQK